jgi:hypothetical protein
MPLPRTRSFNPLCAPPHPLSPPGPTPALCPAGLFAPPSIIRRACPPTRSSPTVPTPGGQTGAGRPAYVGCYSDRPSERGIGRCHRIARTAAARLHAQPTGPPLKRAMRPPTPNAARLGGGTPFAWSSLAAAPFASMLKKSGSDSAEPLTSRQSQLKSMQQRERAPLDNQTVRAAAPTPRAVQDAKWQINVSSTESGAHGEASQHRMGPGSWMPCVSSLAAAPRRSAACLPRLITPFKPAGIGWRGAETQDGTPPDECLIAGPNPSNICVYGPRQRTPLVHAPCRGSLVI